MSIPFTKYVNIISGVGGGGAVRTRDLIGRIFTQSLLVDPNSVLEFTNPTDVATFFGANSDEARRATFYFAWVSPSISSPRKISFARWSTAAFAPAVFGGTDPKNLLSLKAITAGTLSINVNGTVENISGISLATAASFADVATAVQTALNASSDPMLTTSTVAYDAVAQRFIITGGTAGTGSIVITGTSSPNDLGTLMELYVSNGAINTNGSAQLTPDAYVSQSAALSDNFGSFLFMPNSITLDQATAVALWNKTQNVKFIFCLSLTPANATAWSTALISTGGVALTLQSTANTEYPEMAPMIIEAATDYTKRNAAPNYMYKVFPGLTPSVVDGPLSDTYDAQRVNYYGRTQTDGQTIDFYQRGTLCGTSTDPVDQNVYANESWFKSAAGAAFMSLMLSINQLPATLMGSGRVKTVLQSVVNQALFNGVIAPGKTLTVQQQLYVTEQTDDALAWHQVQGIGYWMDVVIQSYVTEDDRTEYEAVYTLIYSKSDSIRKIEGTHVLI